VRILINTVLRVEGESIIHIRDLKIWGRSLRRGKGNARFVCVKNKHQAAYSMRKVMKTRLGIDLLPGEV
jgi:hypothetical protein